MAYNGKSQGYGLKEVADVYLFPMSVVQKSGAIGNLLIDSSGNMTLKWSSSSSALTAAQAEFVFDSLKVSNIEVASEETSAKGGKGNPELISWSYGKTANLTLEDALFSTETLRLMCGGTSKETTGTTETVLTIDNNTFPDTYYMVGKTVIRSYATGLDDAFYVVIPKLHLNVGGTLTMQAEGDPSTFSLNGKALLATLDGGAEVLMQFIKPSTK